MYLVVSEDESGPLPIRPMAAPTSISWPVCGRVVDVVGGLGGRPLRCHLSHGHRGTCDDLGSSELEQWQASTPVRPSQATTLDDVRIVALAQARTYEAMAHWKRERGARIDGERLDAMADALRHLVQALEH